MSWIQYLKEKLYVEDLLELFLGLKENKLMNESINYFANLFLKLQVQMKEIKVLLVSKTNDHTC